MRGSRLLDAYVVRRFALALSFSVAGLVLIATIIDLVENLDTFIDFQASLVDIVLWYVYHTPYWIILTLPISGLLGTLFSLTGLARHSEITAMKALGIGLYRLLLPVFACALVVSAIAFVFTDRIVPAATFQYNQIRERITAHGRPDGSRRQVLLQDVDGQMLYARAYDAGQEQARDIVYERRAEQRLVERIHGSLLEWRQGHWVARNGHTYRLSGAQTPPSAAGSPPAEDPLPAAEGQRLVAASFDSLELTSLTLLPADLSRQQKKPEEMNYAELSQYIRRAEANGEDVARHRVDLHHKVAFPLTFLVIVALGSPLGANARRGGMANSFGLGIAVCFVFYSCVKAAQALGWNQVISPWAGAWAANILFGLLSLLLLWRAPK